MNRLKLVTKVHEFLEIDKKLLCTWLNKNLPKDADWWKKRVVNSLPAYPNNFPMVQCSVKSLDDLDLSEHIYVATRNWDDLKGALHGQNIGKKVLFDLKDVRNKYSHLGSAPLDKNDVLCDLTTIRLFLTIFYADRRFIDDVEELITKLDGEEIEDDDDDDGAVTKSTANQTGNNDGEMAYEIRYHSVPAVLRNRLDHMSIRYGVQLKRYVSYGSDASKIYAEGCSAFGWKIGFKTNFSMMRPLHAADVTPEGFSVWFICHNDVVYKDKKFDDRPRLNFIHEEDIVEVDKDARKKNIDPYLKGDEYRLTFAKTNKNGYVYLGVFKRTFVYVDDKTGELTRTFTRVHEYDVYPQK